MIGVIDPTAFGLHALVLILVEVLLGKVRTVAHKLALCPRAYHVTINSGRFKILLWAVFRDSEELYTFLRDDLRQTPGVAHHETMYQVGQPKRAFVLPG